MRRPFPAVRLTLALLCFAALAACSADDPTPVPRPEQVLSLDGIRWPDYSWPGDGGHPLPDSAPAADGAASDAGADSGGQCPGPAAAQCTSGCATDEVCTEASGGTCVKTVALSGPAADKQVLREVALAYVACWNKAPAGDTLCAAFDTCAMTGTLTEQAITDWVCQKAQISDFPSSAERDAAQQLCKCSMWSGQFVYRPDWKVGSVIAGKRGVVCLAYDKTPWYSFDALNVNDCQYFPPQ